MHCHGNHAFHPNNRLSAHKSPTATVTKQPPPSPQFFLFKEPKRRNWKECCSDCTFLRDAIESNRFLPLINLLKIWKKSVFLTLWIWMFFWPMFRIGFYFCVMEVMQPNCTVHCSVFRLNNNWAWVMLEGTGCHASGPGIVQCVLLCPLQRFLVLVQDWSDCSISISTMPFARWEFQWIKPLLSTSKRHFLLPFFVCICFCKHKRRKALQSSGTVSTQVEGRMLDLPLKHKLRCKQNFFNP